MNEIKQLFANNIRKFGMVIALVGISILFQILTSGVLLTPLNITNIIMQNSYIIILAIGMMLIIITGEMDLSVGSVAGVVGAVSGVLLVTYDIAVFIGIWLCIILGGIIGPRRGFWVAYVNIPALIVTLAGMLIFRGVTLVVLQGETIAPFPNSFRSLSTAFLSDWFGGESINILAILIGILLDRKSVV